MLKNETPDISGTNPDALIIGAWSRKNLVEFGGNDSPLMYSSENASIESLDINSPRSLHIYEAMIVSSFFGLDKFPNSDNNI